jgi:hypothetical protein
MGKKSRYGSGSGMNILDHISESLKTIFWVKNTFFYADPGSIFDPGSRMRDEKIRIRVNITDPQHCPQHGSTA